MVVVGQTERVVATVDKTSLHTEADGTQSGLLALFYYGTPQDVDGHKVVIVVGRISVECQATIKVKQPAVIYGLTATPGEVVTQPTNYSQAFIEPPVTSIMGSAAEYICETQHSLITRS